MALNLSQIPFLNADGTVSQPWLLYLLSNDSTIENVVTDTSGTITANQLVIGVSGRDVAGLGTLGTTTTVLHGNALGAPTFGAVSLTADVSGVLPVSHGGTGTSTQFTQNSIVFAGASGVYSQDNAAFSWNDSTKVLGVKGTLTLSGATSGSSSFIAPATGNTISYTLPSTDGANTNVLMTDGAGNLSWTTAGGGGGTGIQSINGSTASGQTIAAGTGIGVTDSGGIVFSGTYTSGLTVTGTAGQTINLAFIGGGGSSATATVALTGLNTIAGGTALTITASGSGYTSAPTTATASSGTATYVSGNPATVSTVIHTNFVHTIAVDQSFTPTWTGTHTFNNASSIVATKITVPSLITASGAMTVTPAAGSDFTATLSAGGKFNVSGGSLTLSGGTDTRLLFMDGTTVADNAAFVVNKTTGAVTLSSSYTAGKQLIVQNTSAAVGASAQIVVEADAGAGSFGLSARSSGAGGKGVLISSLQTGFDIYTTNTAPLGFGSNADPTMLIIDSNGNVGIKASQYFTWGSTLGISGYGFRDNAGILELKNSGGSWAAIAAGGTGTVTHTSGTLTSGNFILGNGGGDIKDAGYSVVPIGSGGTGGTTKTWVDTSSNQPGIAGGKSFSVTNPTLVVNDYVFNNGTTNNIVGYAFDRQDTLGTTVNGPSMMVLRKIASTATIAGGDSVEVIYGALLLDNASGVDSGSVVGLVYNTATAPAAGSGRGLWGLIRGYAGNGVFGANVTSEVIDGQHPGAGVWINSSTSLNAWNIGMWVASAATYGVLVGGASSNVIPTKAFEVQDIFSTPLWSVDSSGFMDMAEITAPSAPSVNKGRVFFQDNGLGRTQMMVLFNTGAAQQIAIQP